MSKIKFEEVPPEPRPVCGAPSSGRKTAMRCELPPGHNVRGFPKGFFPDHVGRNRYGQWHHWKPRYKDKFVYELYARLERVHEVAHSYGGHEPGSAQVADIVEDILRDLRGWAHI